MSYLFWSGCRFNNLITDSQEVSRLRGWVSKILLYCLAILTGVSAALLLRHLSYFKAIRQLQIYISLLQDFMRYDKKSYNSGIVLCMRPANERRRSLIGWAHSQNDPCSATKHLWLHASLQTWASLHFHRIRILVEVEIQFQIFDLKKSYWFKEKLFLQSPFNPFSNEVITVD